MGVIRRHSKDEQPWRLEAQMDEDDWERHAEPEVYATCTAAEEWHVERIGGSVERYRRTRDRLISSRFSRLFAGSMAWEAEVERAEEEKS